jgi:hypothetical protein
MHNPLCVPTIPLILPSASVTNLLHVTKLDFWSLGRELGTVRLTYVTNLKAMGLTYVAVWLNATNLCDCVAQCGYCVTVWLNAACVTVWLNAASLCDCVAQCVTV